MKCDMDLIRLILLDVEGEEKPDLSGYTGEQVTYHRTLLIEAAHALENGTDGSPFEEVKERAKWPHC